MKRILLVLPAIGDRRLRVISPDLLELFLVNSKEPAGRVTEWDFVADDGRLTPPEQGFLCRHR